jgi:hypothetical protein
MANTGPVNVSSKTGIVLTTPLGRCTIMPCVARDTTALSVRVISEPPRVRVWEPIATTEAPETADIGAPFIFCVATTVVEIGAAVGMVKNDTVPLGYWTTRPALPKTATLFDPAIVTGVPPILKVWVPMRMVDAPGMAFTTWPAIVAIAVCTPTTGAAVTAGLGWAVGLAMNEAEDETPPTV